MFSGHSYFTLLKNKKEKKSKLLQFIPEKFIEVIVILNI